MTTREKNIAKAILDFLHDADGKPLKQSELFEQVNKKTGGSNAEFVATLAICDAEGWLTGVKAKFVGQVWAINEEGEVARLQMK